MIDVVVIKKKKEKKYYKVYKCYKNKNTSVILPNMYKRTPQRLTKIGLFNKFTFSPPLTLELDYLAMCTL